LEKPAFDLKLHRFSHWVDFELDTESDPARESNLWMALTIFLFGAERKTWKRPIFLVSQVAANKSFFYITSLVSMMEQQLKTPSKMRISETMISII